MREQIAKAQDLFYAILDEVRYWFTRHNIIYTCEKNKKHLVLVKNMDAASLIRVSCITCGKNRLNIWGMCRLLNSTISMSIKLRKLGRFSLSKTNN